MEVLEFSNTIFQAWKVTGKKQIINGNVKLIDSICIESSMTAETSGNDSRQAADLLSLKVVDWLTLKSARFSLANVQSDVANLMLIGYGFT